MRHRQASDLLPRFAAGEMGAVEAAGVESHLSACADCRDWLEAYELLAAAASPESAPDRSEHPPSDLLARSAVEPAAVAEAEARLLDEHLEHCPGCRKELRLARASLAQAKGPSPRRDLWAGVRSAFASPGRLAVAASVVFAALAVGAFYISRPVSGDLSVSERTIHGLTTLEAPRLLYATTVSLEDGSQVVLRADEGVSLGEGFTVDAGASLSVETDFARKSEASL